MKKTLLLIVWSLCALLPAFSIPADPTPKRMQQADGTWITIVMKGDCYGALPYTTDGFPLFYNPDTRNYEYAVLKGNAVSGSGIVAEDPDHRTATATAYLKKVNVAKITRKAAEKRKAVRSLVPEEPQRIRTTDYPTTGQQRGLVLLLSFSDKEFTVAPDPNAFYTRMLNERGFTHTNGAHGSAFDYYHNQSGGLFEPNYVVVGPIRLSHDVAHYGNSNTGAAEALIEACKKIKQDTPDFDFSRFDGDNDGIVDNIFFFYAGWGEADSYGRHPETIWPHKWDAIVTGTPLTLDGKSIRGYACANEVRYNGDDDDDPQAAGIGTFCHEFGHVLGLPDHYCTASGVYPQTPGSWDLMDTGCYNNRSHTPPNLSAFERNELGWANLQELNVSTDSTVRLAPLHSSNQGYRVSVPGKDNEYFVVEYRQQKDWDTYLSSPGMLIWHIDYNGTAWRGNTVNNNPQHQRVDLLEYNSRDYAFPGVFNIRQCELKAWSGNTLTAFHKITEKSDSLSFRLRGTNLPAPEQLRVTDRTREGFVLRWEKVADADFYIVSLRDTLGQALAGYEARQVSVDTLALTNLTPGTFYDAAVRAGFSSNLSKDSTTLRVLTVDLPFNERRPLIAAPDNVLSTGFTAHWPAMRDAQAYRFHLTELSPADTLSTVGSGIDGGVEALPELWSVEGNVFSRRQPKTYGVAAPSIDLHSADAGLVIAFKDAVMHEISFWCRGFSSTGNLIVEQLMDSTWQSVQEVTPTNTPQTFTVALGGTQQVRLRSAATKGYFYVDDVAAKVIATVFTPVAGYESIVTTATSQTVKGLKPGVRYAYYVHALRDDTLSLASPDARITTVLPTGLSAAKIGADKLTVGKGVLTLHATAEVFAADGRRVAKGKGTFRLPAGIYLVRTEETTVKVLIE